MRGDRRRGSLCGVDNVGDAVRSGEHQCRRGDGVELSGPVDPVLLDPALARDGGGRRQPRGPQRVGVEDASTSSAVISRMSTSTATIAASWSPSARAASMRSIDPGGYARPRLGSYRTRWLTLALRGSPADRGVGPVGVAPQHDRSTGARRDGIHHGGDIGEVDLDRVAVDIGVAPKPRRVHRVGREMLAQHRHRTNRTSCGRRSNRGPSRAPVHGP